MQWKPPENHQWKSNVDASWYDNVGLADLGWVIRDSRGSLIGTGCYQVKRKWEVKFLEAKAISMGLEAYRSATDFEGDRFKPPLVVESDSIEVVNVLNRVVED